MPTVSLFVPCYIDQLHPRIGLAAAAVLRRAGCEVAYDARQTCCGQPMANCGCAGDAARLARRHLDLFRGAVTVCPSGSCVAMVRHGYRSLGLQLSAEDERTMAQTYELSEYLVTVLGVDDLGAAFPHRVALHRSCHGLRGLGLGVPSERAGGPQPGPPERLLGKVRGLELVHPERGDECCGFGGTFAVTEPEVSVRMGIDRLGQLNATGAEFITATDVSCLMHLDGLRARRGGPRTVHLAEILASL